MSWIARLLPPLVMAAAWASAAPLRTAEEVRMLAPARAAEKLPVALEGIMTSVRGDEYPEFTMQDGTGGVVAHLQGAVAGRVRPGLKVRITGVTDTRPPGPRVMVRELEAGEIIGLPEPLEVTADDLANGTKDCMYVEFSGVIRGARIEESIVPTRLVLDFGGAARRLAVWISYYDETLPAKLVPDTAVTVRGIFNTWRSPSLQPFSNFIVVSDPAKVSIDREAPADPLAIAARSLPDLLSLPADEFTARREKVEGIVTLNWPDGQVVLENPDGSIRLRQQGAPDLQPGDKVAAAGFPTRVAGSLVLEDAVFSSVGGSGTITPEAITAKRLLAESGRVDREGRLLSLDGVLAEVVREEGRLVLRMSGNGVAYRAPLPRGQSVPPEMKPGMALRLTGVCHLIFGEHSKRFGRLADDFELQLQGPGSVVITSGRPWWTMRRLLMAIAPVLAGLLVWAAILKRRMKKRSELLVREIRARHDAELLAAERMRLAGDLHDTLSQSLSGAAMQLEVAGALADEGENPDAHLALAKRLLDRGREDLRRTVWDLSPTALSDENLADALEKVAREQADGCDVVMKRSGEIGELPERIRVHLFRAGQEALNNALRHGRPGKIGVTVEVSEGRVLMEIADDGAGFDPATAPGPEQGHFGLRSLKERIARLGGTLDISSSPQGTRVRAEVPLSP